MKGMLWMGNKHSPLNGLSYDERRAMYTWEKPIIMVVVIPHIKLDTQFKKTMNIPNIHSHTQFRQNIKTVIKVDELTLKLIFGLLKKDR